MTLWRPGDDETMAERPTMVVHESPDSDCETIDTGLLDARGDPIFRAIDRVPFGFRGKH